MPTLRGREPVKYSAVVVDGVNLLARNHHGMQLEWNGESTGGIYGALRFVLTCRKSYPGARIVFLWEGRNSYRKQENKQYKADRVRKFGASGFLDQIKAVNYILPRIGVDQAWSYGLEADDLAAYYAGKASAESRVILASTDWDWWEFHNDSTDIWYKKDLLSVSTMHRMFSSKYNVDETYLPGTIPERMSEWKAIVGGHDNLKGVPRIPKKLVLQALIIAQDLEEVPQTLYAIGYPGWSEKVANHMWLVRSNFSISRDRRDVVESQGMNYEFGEINEEIRPFLLEKGMADFVERFEW